MKYLDQLISLRELLIEEDKYHDKIKNLKSKINMESNPNKKINYRDYVKYNKKALSIERLFFIFSIVISLVAMYRFFPIYSNQFPDQVTYEYFELWVHVFVIGCLLSNLIYLIYYLIKKFHGLRNDSFFEFAKKNYSGAALATSLSFIAFIIFLVLSFLTVFRDASEIYEAKLIEVFNASVLNAVINLIFITGINIMFFVFLPFIKLLSYILPTFIKTRKDIRKYEINNNNSNIESKESLKRRREQLIKDIKKVDIIVDEFKNLSVVNDMIDIFKENPNESLRYALNVAVVNTQIKEYQESINKQVKITNKIIKENNDTLDYERIKLSAHIKVYFQDLKENNMRSNYLNDKQVEEIRKRIRR